MAKPWLKRVGRIWSVTMNIFTTLKYISAHPLSSQNRVAAFKRYFAWRLGTRLLTCPVAVPFVQGTFLLAERGMTGASF